MITNTTTEETYNQILRLQESNAEFELHVSNINSDTITKVIGFGVPVFVDMSMRDPKKEYETIRELNMHDSDLVVIVCTFVKHTQDFVYDFLADFIDDPKMNDALLLFNDDGESLNTSAWNRLIVCCLDSNLHIAAPGNRFDAYNKSIS